MKNLKNYILMGAFSFVALTMSGCATRIDMAFYHDTQKLTPTSKPIFLMTATVKNTYKSYYQPKLNTVFVEKEGAKEKADYFNFFMDDKSKNETNTLAWSWTQAVMKSGPCWVWLMGFHWWVLTCYPFTRRSNQSVLVFSIWDILKPMCASVKKMNSKRARVFLC
jgi:hypothetical protein